MSDTDTDIARERDGDDAREREDGDTVCGVVVRAWPQRPREVARRLTAMAGVEVHASGDDGRMIITVEGGSQDAVADAVMALHRMEGVLSASLVYHHHEGPSGK
jgi:nitrate reductase NapD